MKNNVMQEVSPNATYSKKKKPRGVTALAAVMALGMLSLAGMQPAAAAEPLTATVDLGAAANYSVLAGTTILSTGNNIISQNVGISPGISLTGAVSGVVTGLAALNAQTDLAIASTDAGQRPVTATIDAQLGGQTLTDGVYNSNTGDYLLNGVLTLDGLNDPNSVFILQGDSLTTSAGSQIRLINGAQACNVFFQLDGSANLGPSSALVGTVLALNSITANANATVEGRLLANTGSVNLNANLITAPGCQKTYTPPASPTEVSGFGTIAAAPSAVTSQAFDSAVEEVNGLGEIVPAEVAPVAEPAPVVAPVAEVPAAPAEAPATDPNANNGTVTPADQPLALTGSGNFVAAQPVESVAQNAAATIPASQKSLARTGLTGLPLFITLGLVLLLAGAIFLFINRHRLPTRN